MPTQYLELDQSDVHTVLWTWPITCLHCTWNFTNQMSTQSLEHDQSDAYTVIGTWPIRCLNSTWNLTNQMPTLYLQMTKEAGFRPHGLICMAQAMDFHISGSQVVMSAKNRELVLYHHLLSFNRYWHYTQKKKFHDIQVHFNIHFPRVWSKIEIVSFGLSYRSWCFAKDCEVWPKLENVRFKARDCEV